MPSRTAAPKSGAASGSVSDEQSPLGSCDAALCLRPLRIISSLNESPTCHRKVGHPELPVTASPRAARKCGVWDCLELPKGRRQATACGRHAAPRTGARGQDVAGAVPGGHPIPATRRRVGSWRRWPLLLACARGDGHTSCCRRVLVPAHGPRPPARRSAGADNDARRHASHPVTRLGPTAQLQGQWRCDVARPCTRPPALPPRVRARAAKLQARRALEPRDFEARRRLGAVRVHRLCAGPWLSQRASSFV